jgi:predicted transcriptional regulator
MLTEQEIRIRLKDSNFTAVAKSSGINYHVLYKFMKGEDPRHSTVTALSAYLASLEGK